MFEPGQAGGQPEEPPGGTALVPAEETALASAEETALAVPETELDIKMKELSAGLGGDTWREKRNALLEIKRMGPEAVELAPDVTDLLLDDEDFDVREAARKALIAMGPDAAEDVAEQIHEALQCKDLSNRKVGDEAGVMLRSFPPESAARITPVLLRILPEQNWKGAEAVGQAILDLGKDEYVEVAKASPVLLDMLRSPETKLRANAAHAFGRFVKWAPEEADKVLVEMMSDDPDYWVREAAMKAHQRINGEFDYDVRNNITQAAPGQI